MDPTEPKDTQTTEAEENYNPEEEINADGNYKIVDLPTVQLSTGEELEECLFSCTIKLYRFEKKEW
jgi:hypothetical protein